MREKKRTKLVYIGAGSFRFSIPLFMNILAADILQPMELWLVDIDLYSLKLITSIFKRGVAIHGKDIKIHSTTERKEALPSADNVIISISVGMQESEWIDIHVPLKFGIPQNTGDTVGPGGIFRGIRTIPMIDDIMEDIKDLCPNTIVFNYTNPQGTIMLSAHQSAPDIRAIGLCHEFFYIGSKEFIRFLTWCGINIKAEENFKIIYGGLNHFAWITEFTHENEDIYPKIQGKAFEAYRSGKFGRRFNFYLLHQYGLLNYVEDRHVAEFMPQYYNYFNYRHRPFGITRLRDVQRLNFYRHLVYSIYKIANRDGNRWLYKFLIRPWTGGEKALMMMEDKEQNLPRHHVSNIINKNIISFLPENCVVEVPAWFINNEIRAPKITSFPNSIKELLKIHAKNQQLVVDAARTGNPDLLLKALIADPMCQFIEDDDKIEAMMWNMLFYEKKWQNNFSESIPSYRELKSMKYHVKREELRTYDQAIKEKYKPDAHLKKKSWPHVP
ncbi:MAG: family 4 glycosyl hydrolase [Promethearchaeota archaeon]